MNDESAVVATTKTGNPVIFQERADLLIHSLRALAMEGSNVMLNTWPSAESYNLGSPLPASAGCVVCVNASMPRNTRMEGEQLLARSKRN